MKLANLLATAAAGIIMASTAMAANSPAYQSPSQPVTSQPSQQASNTAPTSPSATATTPSSSTMATANNATTTTPAGQMANSTPGSTTATPGNPFAAPSNSMAQTQSGKTVMDLAASDAQFSTLAKAIKAAGLEQTLSSKGPMTMFAPTNAAFEKLGPAKMTELMNPANKAELTQILTYHVVPQSLSTQTMSNAQPTSMTTAEGQSLSMTRQGQTLQIQNAKSMGTPMTASNGSVIAIDSVLMPAAQAKMGISPNTSSSNNAATQTPAAMTSPATSAAPPATAPAAPATPSAPAAPAAQ